MASPEHVEIVKQGAEAIREWRRANPEEPLRLEGAVLTGVNLAGSDFGPLIVESHPDETVFVPFPSRTGAILSGADLSGVNLFAANLRWAVLTHASLVSADLRSVNLRGGLLQGADLRHSVLFEADLTGAHLRGCRLSNAICGRTVFADVDLAQVDGLEGVRHGGPSSVALDTIVRSQGKIPAAFLRGCGVPEIIIEYIQSLTFEGWPIKYYTCVVSYTEADDTFSERLYNDLQAKGVRCWRWRDDAKWGRTLIAEIDQAIRIYDKLIVICSEKSLQSEPVIREIERALQKEAREHKEVLFPIAVDGAVFEWDHPLQPDLTRKFVGDFRTWKEPEKYRKSLDRLFDALQAETAADAAASS